MAPVVPPRDVKDDGGDDGGTEASFGDFFTDKMVTMDNEDEEEEEDDDFEPALANIPAPVISSNKLVQGLRNRNVTLDYCWVR